MSKVVVTGGAGFLGSHIARGLIDRGEDVRIVDNFSSGSLRNLKDVGVRKRCTVGDLKDGGFAMAALRGADTVFHFAAEVGSVAYLHGSDSRELAALQANLVVDANVLRACVQHKVKTVVYASSVSVYPFQKQLGRRAVFSEEDSEREVSPEGGYGWSKYLGELELRLMTQTNSGVARIFHAYGKNIYLMPDRSQVIGSLLRKAITYPKEGFKVWGDGSQRRCFVYIDDAMEAIFRLRDYVETHGSLTVNIGSAEEVTVKDLAERVVALSSKRIKVRFDPKMPTGALARTPDLARAKKVLGWAPTTTFGEGLSATYEWAEGRLAV